MVAVGASLPYGVVQPCPQFFYPERPPLKLPSTRRAAPTLLALSFVITLCLTSTVAQAGKHRSTKSTVKESYGGSAETTKERERRLARECRGRPNAGACLGFGG